MINDFKIEMLADRIILQDGWYACAGHADGNTVLVTAEIRKPVQEKHEMALLISKDGGYSWESKCYDAEKNDVYLATTSLKLSDGSALGITSTNFVQAKIRRSQRMKPFIMRTTRVNKSINTAEEILNGRYEDDYVKVNIPDLAAGNGDSQNYTAGVAQQGLMQMDDGSLLMTMYGNFYLDRIPIPYFADAYQYRCWVCISKDNGVNWDYLSTVCSNDIYRLPELAEGYCEGDLVKVSGKRLLCVMRTGGNPTGNGSMERYTPLVSCFSEDSGRNWSLPQKISDYGVYPRLLKMENGVIVCLSGRPGFFMLFSLDGGVSWKEPVEVAPNTKRDFFNSPSGYGYIFEGTDGILNLIYDDIVSSGEAVQHIVKIRKYKFIANV